MRCGFDSRQSQMASILFWYVPLAWLAAQGMKVALKCRREGPQGLRWATRAGGMPSTHSALVSSLVAAVGVVEGLQSTAFIVSGVFALIVLYDAWGHHALRRHTSLEVVSGIVVGLACIAIGAVVHGLV